MAVVPFILGFAIAYLLKPLVDRMTAVGLRRDRVVVVLYVVFVGGGLCLFLWMLPTLIHEVYKIIGDSVTYTSTINQVIDGINAALHKFLKPVFGAKAADFGLSFRADHAVTKILESAQDNLMNLAQIAMWIVIIPFVSFFALSQGKQWIDKLFDWTPSRHVESLLGLMAELNARLGDYLRGVMMESMIVGFVTMIGLYLLGVEGAVLYGLLTGFVNVVPFMGPLIGGSLAILAAIIQGKSAVILLGIFLLFVLVRLIDDFVLIPFIVGNSVKLHPLLILFSILVGVEWLGFIGLVFAVPITVVIKVILTLFLKSQRDNLALRHQSALT